MIPGSGIDEPPVSKETGYNRKKHQAGQLRLDRLRLRAVSKYTILKDVGTFPT